MRNSFRFLLLLLLTTPVLAQQAAMTFPDVMQFRDIKDPAISNDGRWVAFELAPDRGNGSGEVRSTSDDRSYSVARGSRPQFSDDSRWVAFTVRPDFLEVEKAEKPEDRPKTGLALLDLTSGAVSTRERVRKLAFSEDSRWLAYSRFQKDDPPQEKKEEQEEEKEKDEKPKRQVGTALVLRDLDDGTEQTTEFVNSFLFSPDSNYLAYILVPEKGTVVVAVRSLVDGWERPLLSGQELHASELAWNEETGTLSFLAASGEKVEKLAASLWKWKSGDAEAKEVELAGSDGWYLPLKNSLKWTESGKTLFLGLRPGHPQQQPDDEDSPADNGDESDQPDPYSVEKILEKREVDVWHWDDPLIIPNQKNRWNEEKDRTYLAAYHADREKLVQLAGPDLPEADPVENERFVLATSPVPYQKEITWEGRLQDVYTVDLESGERRLVKERLDGRPSLSPGGRFITYFREGDWYLYGTVSEETRNLTADLDVPFANEDHDYPSDAPGYGVGGWLEDDAGVIVYDKYDIWLFPTAGGDPTNLTAGHGRHEKRIFRLIRTDPEQKAWEPGSEVLVSSYHDRAKNYGFYVMTLGRPGARRLLEERKRFQFVAKAEEAETLIFTREDYDEFPDLWVTTTSFDAPRKLTGANPQMEDFAWGSSELVEWRSLDGIPLQGVLIKPGNYQEGKRYPVLVYFYRLFSQRLHQFNQPVVNHRPCFPLYASNGYAIFLPDVRFEVGWPGFSATKSIVPGVQKLIDMGVADPEAIALHGHSWSGYQTAFVVTQTDIFKAAIAGAPVSNMTSAYSGIRWGSGLARQFQYEMSQSRIGGSLWEYPERYIENSPVFFADRINTPLLILFGDEDGAVPWYQGIELYLALRRLEKPAWFLQYRGEPHHPQKYPNKLDWAIKMKEFLDHFLKGEPAPEWLAEGIPYEGE